jgi:hypothetical protein
MFQNEDIDNYTPSTIGSSNGTRAQGRACRLVGHIVRWNEIRVFVTFSFSFHQIRHSRRVRK